MDDTTLTYEILDDLVQDWFDWFYTDNDGDGEVNLDLMVEGIMAEYHPAVIKQVLDLTGEETLRAVLMSYITHDQGAFTN